MSNFPNMTDHFRLLCVLSIRVDNTQYLKKLWTKVGLASWGSLNSSGSCNANLLTTGACPSFIRLSIGSVTLKIRQAIRRISNIPSEQKKGFWLQRHSIRNPALPCLFIPDSQEDPYSVEWLWVASQKIVEIWPGKQLQMRKCWRGATYLSHVQELQQQRECHVERLEMQQSCLQG